MSKKDSWVGKCDLCFERRRSNEKLTIQHGSFNAPFKLMKTTNNVDGRCEVPLLHTAGGLIGGDELKLNVKLRPESTGLITTVAAQKVYGTVGRSNRHPEGLWAKQFCNFHIDEHADLEWIPQELIIFEGGLYEQNMQVRLNPKASFLSTEIVRLGRTSAGETLGNGCWRSKVEVSRNSGNSMNWEFIDQLEFQGDSLVSENGLDNKPVLGSLLWIAPDNLSDIKIEQLIKVCRSIKQGLEGTMTCSSINKGLSARYLGKSTQEARLCFLRIWSHIRETNNLSSPKNLRVWPLQEYN